MTEKALRDSFGEYLVEVGENNKNLVVLDADLSSSTRTNKFAKHFPERFFNMGIAEQNMLGTAMGLAISGKIPIVSGFSIFTTGRAWEFIRIACHDNLNLKIITTHSGFVGEDGSTHHALEDLSLMTALSNLTVLIPSDNIELLSMLNFSINKEGPFYIRLPRGNLPRIHSENYKFILGKPDILKDGNDLCIIGSGYGTTLGFKSAISLEKELKCSIKIINIPTIKPIDVESLIIDLNNVKGILVIEEHNIYCGLGSILSRIISQYKSIPMKFIGIENSFGVSGKREELLSVFGFNYQNIKENLEYLLNY